MPYVLEDDPSLLKTLEPIPTTAALDRDFAIAAGSVCGREHRRTGRNNQDAWSWSADAGALIAVVADGCSGGCHSELGARLGARLVTAAIRRQLELRPHAAPESLLAAAREDLLSRLGYLATAMGGPAFVAVRDHFLFTLLGALVRRDETVVFSLGDGAFWLNGARHELRYAGNAPPYLGYCLVPQAVDDPALADAPFRIRARCPTAELESLLIGTDGALDLERHACDAVSEMTTAERYWQNPQAIRRCLTRLNRERTRIDRQTGTVHKFPGLLPDDTTLILLRRR